MNFFRFFKKQRQIHCKIFITGKVQNIGFRRFACRRAKRLKLKGFVRYQVKGLYIEAEGSENRVRRFIKDCRVGPEGTETENFTVTEGELEGFKSFTIERSKKV